MFGQNRTPKKSDQLWELVLTPREAIIVGRPFLAANKRTAGFVCTTFNGVLPPSNIYAIHLFA